MTPRRYASSPASGLLICLLLTIAAAARAQACRGIEVIWPEWMKGLLVPVVVEPAGELRWPAGDWSIDGRPLQRLPGPGHRHVVMLEAGRGRTSYELRQASAATSRKQVAPRLRVAPKAGRSIDLLRDRTQLFSYVSGMRLPRGVKPALERSSYIHPVRDLLGVDLLDDFPRDHRHHRGISWMWPEISVAGEIHDLWHLRGIAVRFDASSSEISDGPVAGFEVQSSWRTAKKRVMSEALRLLVSPVHISGQARGYQIALTFTWQAVSGPVVLSGQKNARKGYGGVGLRLAPRKGLVITTPKGVVKGDSLRERFAWADGSARFRGAAHVSGIALMPHPKNAGHPNEWILRRYGFMGECWPGLGRATFEPGRPRSFRYLIYVHMGDAREAQVARVRRSWLEPPRVRAF